MLRVHEETRTRRWVSSSIHLPALVALKQGLSLNQKLLFNLGWLASELQASLLPSVGITSSNNHAWLFK